eukprot:Selendium_serpulae@DN6493_c1_g1_i3.p1
MLEKIIRSSTRWNAETSWRMIRDVIADAVLVHNATPHMTTGETPFALMCGQDLILPGWQSVTGVRSEEDRLTEMGNMRMRELLLAELKKWESNTSENKSVSVGDIVVFRLSEYERLSNEHITGEPKYRAKWSLPQRVMEVKHGVVRVKPLWRVGKLRQV